MTSSYHKIYDKLPCLEHDPSNLIYIPLINKNNEFVCYAISNLSLKDKLLEFSYHVYNSNNNSNQKYAKSNLGIPIHEIIIGKTPEKGYVIDHVNGDGLDNRELNLRFASHNLNAQNKPKRSNTTSKYIGVWFSRNRWHAKISYKYEITNLGAFEKEIDAAKIYDVYATFLHREEEPITNNLLTDNEIRDIKNNGIPEKYKIIKKIKNLPTNINLTQDNTYSVRIVKDGKRYGRNVKTLEEAIMLKKQISDEIFVSDPMNRDITRNEEGLAIIHMINGFDLIVDDDMWHDLSQYGWNSSKNRKGDKFGYPIGTVKGKTTILHRHVYETYIGLIPNHLSVDHVNSDDLFDVRRQNLRLSDRSLQSHNRKVYDNRIDRYKGVEFSGFSYRVSIDRCNYGCYDTAEEAAEKANEVYKLKYGNNALLNVIDYSKKTTKYDRIPENLITKEYIMKINKVNDFKNVISIKNLDFKNGGVFVLSKIKFDNLEENKKLLIDMLYSQEEIKKPSRVLKLDRTPEDLITKEYIMNLTKVFEVKNVVSIKKLNTQNGGSIIKNNITLKNLDEYKKIIVETLYPADKNDDENTLIEQINNPNKLHLKHDVIDQNIIDKQYMMSIKTVTGLVKFVKDKKLNIKDGGPIKVKSINLKNLEEHKKIIIDTLYPSQ